MSLAPRSTRIPATCTDAVIAGQSTAASSAARDLHQRLRAATARLTRLRAGVRAEVAALVEDGRISRAEANDMLRRLSMRPTPRTFHCRLKLPVTIDVGTASDAVALRQAQRILTEGIASLAEITIWRSPDCFGIDAPRGAGDGQVNRLVHTTLPLALSLTVAGPESVWRAAKHRLDTQFRRVPQIRANVAAITKITFREQDSEEIDAVYG